MRSSCSDFFGLANLGGSRLALVDRGLLAGDYYISDSALLERTLAAEGKTQHQQHMRRAGLVATRKDGKLVFYNLTNFQLALASDEPASTRPPVGTPFQPRGYPATVTSVVSTASAFNEFVTRQAFSAFSSKCLPRSMSPPRGNVR